MDYKKRIGEKIFRIRGSRSMDEFAELIGVTKSSVHGYEKGINIPRKKVLQNIISLSNEPNQTITDFIYGTYEEKQDNEIVDFDNIKLNANVDLLEDYNFVKKVIIDDNYKRKVYITTV